METTSGTENGPFSIELTLELTSLSFDRLAVAVVPDIPSDTASGSWGTRRLSIPRKRGALLFAGEYAGKIGGTLVTRLVRMPISMLHWTMVSLRLNGAISNARL